MVSSLLLGGENCAGSLFRVDIQAGNVRTEGANPRPSVEVTLSTDQTLVRTKVLVKNLNYTNRVTIPQNPDQRNRLLMKEKKSGQVQIFPSLMFRPKNFQEIAAARNR